jgi:hypothetical protein
MVGADSAEGVERYRRGRVEDVQNAGSGLVPPEEDIQFAERTRSTDPMRRVQSSCQGGCGPVVGREY